MASPATRVTQALSALTNPRVAAAGAGLVGTAAAALSTAPERLARLFGNRYPTVAVTGMTGVGKTALVDRLTKRNPADGAAEVGSATMEKRTRRRSGGHGFRFRVVPGQNAATRLGALDDVFHDEPVAGVVHVVANGYATARRTAGTTGPAQASREQQLAAELEDWTITAHRIAAMAVRREHPTWLVIAVTKCDLYAADVDAVVRSYSPGSGTPFGDKLDELRALAGAAKLSIDVLPVCAPTHKDKTCTDRLSALETRLAQLCGHV